MLWWSDPVAPRRQRDEMDVRAFPAQQCPMTDRSPSSVPSDLAPKSVKTTMAGISWMRRSHCIWWAGARPDRTLRDPLIFCLGIPTC